MSNSEEPPPTPPAPRALKLVALLFVASGIFSAVTIVTNCFNSNLRFDLGILGFWIAPGLLAFKPKWLKWAKLYTWLDLILIDIVSLFFSFAEPQNIKITGPWFVGREGLVLGAYLVGSACLSLWKLRVLTRPEIVELFPMDDDALPLTTEPLLFPVSRPSIPAERD